LIFVIPAKAGIQVATAPSLALASRLRGGDEREIGLQVKTQSACLLSVTAFQRAVVIADVMLQRPLGAECCRPQGCDRTSQIDPSETSDGPSGNGFKGANLAERAGLDDRPLSGRNRRNRRGAYPPSATPTSLPIA
jgi:hypothetical protein